ncbi:MAG TPA: hypothetical protein VF581_04285 [Flavobacterium sp.]
MKKLLIIGCSLFLFNAAAQDHFAGMNTSQRVGILNAQTNPAELTNLTSKYEIQLLGISANVSNNKIGFSDLTGDADFEDLIFRGSEPVDVRFDGEVNFPSFAFRYEDWGFAVSTKAYAKLNMTDVDVNIGDAISNNGINAIFGSTTISNNYNQRINGTTWGEVGLSAARIFYDTEKHIFSAGATVKLLFPGSYANFGADSFTGTINNQLGNAYLTDTNANLNIAYSGNLAGNFTNFNDYSGSLFGKLNGLAADLGVNYRMKDKDEKEYIINAGLSVRNIGGMTFKDANNSSTNYLLEIPPPSPGDPGLDLSQFDDVESLEEVEQILLNSGYLDRNEPETTDFKVKLPTVFTAYADVKIIPKFYATVFARQKLQSDEDNDQIASQNVLSLTPRYTLENFEVWSTWSANEVSGLSGGLGIRAYGFFIGSSSAFTMLSRDAKQGDVYIGYSFGLQ